jgi:hypothetical protein
VLEIPNAFPNSPLSAPVPARPWKDDADEADSTISRRNARRDIPSWSIGVAGGNDDRNNHAAVCRKNASDADLI